MPNSEEILVQLAAVIVLGIGAQWLAWKLRLPSILLLLVCGFVAGPVAMLIDSRTELNIWHIEPGAIINDALLLSLVSISVALILFEGGLTLKLSEFRASGVTITNLVTIGALITWAFATLSAFYVLGLTMSMSLILGAMLVVTGPTVVGPLLQEIRPRGRVGAVAKWEGIVIDPIGATLGVLVFVAIETVNKAGTDAHVIGSAGGDALWGLAATIFFGVLFGVLGALPMAFMMRRYWIPDFLQVPVLLMVVIAAFAASNHFAEESGLLAVTLMGVILANQKMVTVHHIQEFKEHLRVVLISLLFIVLSARIQPEQFGAMFTWRNALFLLLLIAFVRPACVWISTMGRGFSWQERVFLSWLAPRGIVAAALASVFALRIEHLGKQGGHLGELSNEGHQLLPITFFVIIVTVTFYGLTARPVARWLGLASPNPQGLLIAGADRACRAIAKAIHESGFRVVLVDTNWANVQAAKMESLEAHYQNVLDEEAIELLDLGGIGRFLSLTPNDEINTLATQHYTHMFGRGGVYQLSSTTASSGNDQSSSERFRGRTLFAPEATHANLHTRLRAGAVVKMTKLTGEFDVAAYRELYGPDALILFIITESGRLTICSPDAPSSPSAGDTLVALVEVKEEEGAD